MLGITILTLGLHKKDSASETFVQAPSALTGLMREVSASCTKSQSTVGGNLTKAKGKVF